MDWLIPRENFNHLIGENDNAIEILWENGIICDEHAEMQLIYASTWDYDMPDCPYCGGNDNRHYLLKNKIWKCRKCRSKFSITTGRYIHDTKLPITHWWRFAWLVGKSKILNSCFIARDLNVTQKTAWYMIDTLKRALKDNGAEMKNLAIDITQHEVLKLLMKVEKKNDFITLK